MFLSYFLSISARRTPLSDLSTVSATSFSEWCGEAGANLKFRITLEMVLFSSSIANF
jgi:hypothetical protein